MKIIGAVAVINIVARLFGFLREIVIADKYGLGTYADAITSAYTIPNFIYLVVGGALTTAFISVYHQGKDTNLFVRKAFTIVLVTSILLSIFFMVFTTPTIQLFFSDLDGEELALVRSIFLWMMPSTIFLMLSTWMSGLLNINGKFNLSSMAILIYNASFVGIAMLLANHFGPEAFGIGAFFSAVLMVFFLWLGVKNLKKYSLKPSFSMDANTKKLWVIALPILFGGASLQFYFVIHRIAAGFVGDGAIAAVNYASKLSSFPQAIMMTAVTTVIYPLLSKKEGEGDDTTIRALYKKGLFYLTALIIPVTIIAYVFAEPLVTLVFGRGNFDQASIEITTPLFQAFVLSMFFLAANTYITRFYYAKGNSMTPVIFSLISVFGVNLAIIFLMIESYGAIAIAYGTVISAAINFILLVAYARLRYKL